MDNFDRYSALYNNTDPPPIITEGYKRVQQNYYNHIIGQQQSNYDESFVQYKPKEIQMDVQTSTGLLQNSVVDTAKQLIGTQYHWGGTTPNTGFDSLGLVRYAYKEQGIELPKTISGLENFGVEVPLDDIQIGDIILTSNKQAKLVSDITDDGIFTIESNSKDRGVSIYPLVNTSNIVSVRRVKNDKASGNYIVDYFMNKGLTKSQAKGIYGNLMQESGGRTTAKSSDGHNSYGLAQWTGSRKQKLFSMYGNRPTAKQQLDFLWWELNNTHTDALKALRSTSTVSDATRVFMDKFEKPHKNYANFKNRLKYANSIA